MNYFIRASASLLLFAAFLLLPGCRKENKFLFRDSGTWEIESMQVDYLNASGGTDSTVSSGITGFFMFYDTPTTGDSPFYLSTNGMTIRGIETHSAHFYRAENNSITMVSSIGQTTPDRLYDISDHGKNKMTLDYTGQAGTLYSNYSGKLKEHIVLKRIKF